MWRKIFWPVIILFLLDRALFAENIFSKALYDFDEARYAEVAKNVIRTNNWFVPLAGGPDEPRNLTFYTLENKEQLYPYFWKPPLHTITISLFYRLFGINELAVRLPSFLSGLGILFLVYLIAKKYWPKQKILPYIAVTLLATHSDFAYVTNYGNSDALLLFLSLAGLFFASKKQIGFSILSGLFFGLAFLTKSVAVFWLPFLIMAQFFYLQDLYWFKKLVIILISFVFTVFPWHIFMYNQFGTAFIQHYLLANTVERALGSSGNQAPFYWYLIYIANFWQPFLVLGVFLVLPIMTKLYECVKDYWFLIFWILIIFIPFSYMQSKVWWYIFPIIIPVSLLFAKTILDFKLRKQKVWAMTLVCLIIIFNIGITIQRAEERTNHNQGIKKLAKRHPKIVSLSVYKIPYEAALFYFNTGNISQNNLEAKYLLTKKEFLADQIRQYKLVDKEGDFYLLTK